MDRRFGSDGRAVATRVAGLLTPALAVLVVQQVFFPVPLGVWLQGAVLGLLNAMIVAGLVLVYRATRVVNLAQASIGLFPANLAGAVVLFGAPTLAASAFLSGTTAVVVLLGLLALTRVRGSRLALPVGASVVYSVVGLRLAAETGWWGGLAMGLTVAVLSGIGIHTIVMQRFRRAPRLVVTVATIGLAQYFVVNGLLVPRLWNKVALVTEGGAKTGFEVPGNWTVTIGQTVFHSAEVVAVCVALVSILAIGLALRYTDIGIAVRAAANRADRAVMLGIPVERLEAGVWVVASVLAFVSTYVQAGILGLEITSGIGLRVMVAALGAMVLGGFVSMPAMVCAAVAIGVLAQASGPAGGHSLTLTDAVLAAVVLAGVVLRRASARRSDRENASSWQAAAEPRPIPPELVGRAPIAWARRAGLALVVVIAAVVPGFLSDSVVLRLSGLCALIVIALSVVVLTGWAGEVTLGQMSFAAVGAAVSAYCTLHWRFDFLLCVLVGGAAAACAAGALGALSMRRSGIFVAVTTLAFALATINYLLNPTVATWIPTDDVARRDLLGVISLQSRYAMYLLALAVTVGVVIALARIRSARVGRLLRSLRDNPTAAQAYAVRVPLARVLAFSLSGFLAGIGGALLFYVNERYEVALFSATEGLNVFVSAVVGGVASLLGAVVGVLLVDGGRALLSGPLALLPSAIGVLGVLMVLPGGVAELLYRARTRWLRGFARSRAIHVPSLVADSAVDVGLRGGAAAKSDMSHVEFPAEPWLAIRGVDVAYDKVQVLFGADLHVSEGQIVALLGTNGAGKSTLLRAIGGVAPVTAGSIHLGEVDLGALRPELVATHGIAQMPGGKGVFPSLTVEENLRSAAWLFRRDRPLVAQRIAEALAAFPVLDARLDSPAADLSGGQQQQLALAMALMAKPRLLLVDELSLGLAPAIVEGLLTRLRAVRDEGASVVIVEQSVNVALEVADHAYFMEKGEVRFSGSAADLLAQPDLVRAVYLKGVREALGSDSAASVGSSRSEAVSEPTVSQADPARGGPALEARGLSVSFGGGSGGQRRRPHGWAGRNRWPDRSQWRGQNDLARLDQRSHGADGGPIVVARGRHLRLASLCTSPGGPGPLVSRCPVVPGLERDRNDLVGLGAVE